MNIEGKKVLVLGGAGLVGLAVCRELLAKRPKQIQIHSLRDEESIEARELLEKETNGTEILISSGDIFGLTRDTTREEKIKAQLKQLADEDLDEYRLYNLLTESRPEIVIDCVNTATGIAYRDVYAATDRVWHDLGEDNLTPDRVKNLLEALYIPRLIRHIQVLYRGMSDAKTRSYFKVGTSGTGGMGLNVPYTHSEEKPSRVLLSKSAVAGAHSMLLFLMARTPDAPMTK